MGSEPGFRMLQRAAWRLAGWQLGLTAVLGAAAAAVGGGVWAVSALAGGATGALGGLYQALRMFRVDASVDPAGFLRSVYVGEALKIVLTVALFIAAIVILQAEMVPAIVAYAATSGVYWVALGTGYPWIRIPGADAGPADSSDG